MKQICIIVPVYSVIFLMYDEIYHVRKIDSETLIIDFAKNQCN